MSRSLPTTAFEANPPSFGMREPGEMGLEIFVFSFNRGKYLRNCLESVFRHAPDCKTTVVDDASTDPSTQRVLDDYRRTLTVVTADPASHTSLGGLYNNMNWAVEHAQSELALFIQDDMQLVRELTEADRIHMRRFFDHFSDSIQLHTCFMKNATKSRIGAGLELDTVVPVYFRDGTRGRRAWFSAVGIVHVRRLRERGITLEQSESGNNEHISRVAGRMGMTPYPFMMWLPFAESTKFRRKGLIQRYVEWRSRAGLYPYRPMTAEEVERLFARDVTELPVAEQTLTPAPPRAETEWMFEDPVKYYRIPKKLFKLRKQLAAR